MTTNQPDIRSQVYGSARLLIPFFENHFKDFASADQKYMVVIQWVSGLSGPRSAARPFFDNRKTAEETYAKYASSKEVLCVYLFEWDLGISMIKDSASEFTDAFHEALKRA